MSNMLKLARVKWYLGQTLLPEHMVAQEQALGSEAFLRDRLEGLPESGIAEMRFNEQLLSDGVLNITALLAVMPDGTLIDVPRNSALPTLSLSIAGSSRLAVYLHLLGQSDTALGNRLYEKDPKTVQRLIHRTQLTLTDKLDGSVAFLRLGEFEKGASGQWQLAETYIPPLLQVGSNPFLKTQLEDLQQKLERLEQQLIAQLQDTFLRLERLAVTRSTLAVMYSVMSALSDVRYGVTRHPFYLFKMLRELYFELCSFHETLPEQTSIPYIHSDLGGCFGRLFALLTQRLRLLGAQQNYIKFAKMNDLFRISGLPEEIKNAQEVYLLIQRTNLHERIPTDDIKLSATSRLALVHRLVLRGIPFKHLERVHFQHSFGPEIDFYQIMLTDEWVHALREGSLAFYQLPAMEKASAYLFWR